MKRIIAYNGEERDIWLIINCNDITYIEIEEDKEDIRTDYDGLETYAKNVMVHLKNGEVFPIYTYPNNYSLMTGEELMDRINKLLASKDENEAIDYECL